MSKVYAFTCYVPVNHKHSILTEVEVGLPILKIYGFSDLFIRLKALIDTGASSSAISKRIVEKYKLQHFKFATVNSAHGKKNRPAYTVDAILPNKMIFRNCHVTQFYGEHEFDFIIGLDILSHGDMAITNADGKVIFSFCMPTNEKHIDFRKHCNA